MNDEDGPALATIALLERRLERIEFLLGGNSETEDTVPHVTSQNKDQTVYARLAKVETGLGKLSSRSPAIRDLLDLYSTHPELFQPTLLESTPNMPSKAELITIINSRASAYPSTVSRLASMKDMLVPSAESSACLAALRPRIAQLELLQASQEKEIAELQSRSLAILQRWYRLEVLGGGDRWTEWEERVFDVERGVGQDEAFRAQESSAAEAYQSGRKAVHWKDVDTKT